MGAKMMPTPKSSGRTVLGVRMGCQAFNRCWRKAVSVLPNQLIASPPLHDRNRAVSVLGGLLLFCFFSGSSLSRMLLESVFSMVGDVALRCVIEGLVGGGGTSVGVARVVAAFPSGRQRLRVSGLARTLETLAWRMWL